MTDTLEQQKQLLEDFICDKGLKELEKRFDKFNIFDCLRLTRTEIRHSNFLFFFLDSNETHGLKDYFLKEFLKHILLNNGKLIEKINNKNLVLKKYKSDNETLVEKYSIPSLFDIDYWDMQNAEILREHENIDLLIIDEINKFVFIIENKVDTSQHDNQLTKYRTYVDEQYPSEQYKKLYIYLKPQKEEVEKPYIYINYSLIKVILDDIVNDKQDKISNEIITAIKHYKYIIERDFMQKDEISEICRKIYKKHKKAIDLINKYSDTKAEMFEILKEVINENPNFGDITYEPNKVLCLPTNINNIDKLKFADWKPHNFIIQLNFINFTSGHKDMCFELLMAPPKNEEDNIKSQKLKDIINKKLGLKLKRDPNRWDYTPPFNLISLDDYYSYNSREEVKNHITNKLKTYEDLYINGLREALNEFCES